MTDRTSICPTCGRRAPEAVYRTTDSELHFAGWVGAAGALIVAGLYGLMIGMGTGILIFLGVGHAVRAFMQHRRDKECARFARENARVIEG